ncbi:MAG: TauD/TfdA family dioxygenase [Deltaproteobacteria bacterium]|nr:TauD/TfdA family dioxygenase [Deltaproteobacteria bacterium]
MGFEVRPLAPIGAEICGLALGRGLADADFEDLRRTIVEHGVVVLHDQHLTPAQHVALGRRFGEPERGAFNEDTPDPELILLTNRGRDGQILPADDVRMRLVNINEGWHTDSSFRPIPATFSLFAAVVVPPVGGDTFFASLRVAWEALTPTEQDSVRGLVGLHDYKKAFLRFGSTVPGNPIFDLPVVRHPLVRRHPESGETTLYTSEHVMGIEGMTDDEARPILERLLRVAIAPERVYRHTFRVGDLVIWDNRHMIHRAQGFDQEHVRVMHHVRIAGTEPVVAA